jgi:hypothetical protein
VGRTRPDEQDLGCERFQKQLHQLAIVCGWFADQWAIENGTAVVYRVVVLPDFLMGGHTPWPQQATYDGGTPGIDLATPFPQALTNAGVWAALTNVHAVALAGTNQWIDGNGSVWREHPVTNWYAVPVNAEVYYDGVSYFPPPQNPADKNLSGIMPRRVWSL